VSGFQDVADSYKITDSVFADAELKAYDRDDEAAFDRASQARKDNDQLHFLYLFTRFEFEVSAAFEAIAAAGLSAATPWQERRVWQAWLRGSGRDIGFLAKVEILTDKGRPDYAVIKRYYDGRNTIAHGRGWDEQFWVPTVAQDMADLVGRFART
jgi:hypothetical protein